MDRRSSDVNIQETNINQLIELILKRLRPIAAKRSIELVLESFKPVIAEVDETKLTLALSNLVENGIKYNKDEGWVHVSLNVDSKYFYVKVEDSGIGIPEESQEHIFERFYRVDKSHSREIGWHRPRARDHAPAQCGADASWRDQGIQPRGREARRLQCGFR